MLVLVLALGLRLVWFGMIWHGSLRYDLVWFGMVTFGLSVTQNTRVFRAMFDDGRKEHV